MSNRFMIVSPTNTLLAGDVGPAIARLVNAARPAFGVYGRDENVAATLKRDAEVYGVHAGRVLIPRKAGRKARPETIETTEGSALVIERYDDGMVKIKLGDGRVFKIREAA